MATIDLGKIKLKWQGTYLSETSYVPDDVVEYTDGSVTSSYICVTASSGNTPSSGGTAHPSWEYMAKGQATSPTTTRGDIIFRGASADQRLAAGTSGYFLKTQGSSADPVWAEVSTSGKVLGITELVNNTRTSMSTNQTYNIVTGSYTQVKASSKIFWWSQCWWRGNYSGERRYQFLYNGSEKNIGQSGYHYSNHSHRFGGHGSGMFTGDSSTGSKSVVWREHDANGSSSQKSGNVHNPNSSDDARLSQHASNIIIMEVDI